MPDVGQTLSHYQILTKLGQGGMGEVFLARDTVLERDVAIKVLPRDMRSDHLARERFLREARAIATINHPHICVVHETNEAEGTPFIVMEYLDGASLRERLSGGPLPLAEALRLAVEVAEALEAAHGHHIVHRDLKPANVMLTGTGHAKVTDFGLARRLMVAEDRTTEVETVTQLTRPGTTVGTLAYMSPEQLQGQPVDHRSDVFAFGTMLYEMLTGVHPFKRDEGMGTAAAVLGEEPAPLAPQVPGAPKRLVELVSKMLAKAPARRVQSAGEVREELKGILLEVEPPPEMARLVNLRKLGRSLKRPQVAIPTALVVLGLAALGTWFLRHQGQVRWARQVLLPEIEEQIAANDAWRNLVPPYRLALQAEAILGNDPKLAELLSKVSLKIDVLTEPAGARVFMKEYETPDAEWTYLGITPLKQVRVPVGIFRWKLEEDGYETVLAAASTWGVADSSSNLVRTLDRVGTAPPGMVRVSTTETPAGRLPDFFIGRYEVTNREYKAFVDAGGYGNREYWQQPFVQDGRRLSWDEAMRELVDASGRPGPATWMAGDYPLGQAEYPVSGVNWYEAAAYAAYAGQSLPTQAHWDAAAGMFTPMVQVPQLGGFGVLAPFANFGGQGAVAVGTENGITAYGAYDMAGNVREWCWNEMAQGRVIRGGAWSDNSYEFGNPRWAPPMDRSARNGLRLAAYPDRRAVPETAFAAQAVPASVDFGALHPASDAVFRVYKEQFSYDPTPLNARVEYRETSPGGWIREKISFDAAYGGERVLAYLFLPTNARAPYQTVVYFPGSASTNMTSSRDLESYYEFPMFLSFLVRNGRAVLYPVYKGTFERSSPTLTALADVMPPSHAYTEYLIQVVKDFRRSVDYLETRPDIDRARLAYYGMSWGGTLGAIIPAVEPRLAAVVLVAGGFQGSPRPEASEINYVTRVRTPTLMLNGKYDSVFGLEQAVKPMFQLLGTPAADKRLMLYDTDHIPPRTEYIKETLAWLDKYLGPVTR
jgi:dienelactone hydrolase/predicted Ser/Thr protein kinase